MNKFDGFIDKFDSFIMNHPIVSVIGVAAVISSLGLLFNPAASLPLASIAWAAFITGYCIVSKK